jgi:hypothetical protein
MVFELDATHFMSALAPRPANGWQDKAPSGNRVGRIFSMDRVKLDCLTGCQLAMRSVTGATFAQPADLNALWQLSNELLGSQVAGLPELEKAYGRNQCTMLAVKRTEADRRDSCSEEISGVLAVLFLSWAGKTAVPSGSFSPREIDPEWLVDTTSVPVASYVWAMAALDLDARRRIVLLGRRLSLTFSQLDQYARPVTPAGERLVKLLGFTPEREVLYGQSAHGSLWLRPATP